MSLHPFAEGNIASAQKHIEAALVAMRKATTARTEAETWRLIGLAMGHASHVKAQLNDAMQIEAMKDDGEETAA